MALSSKEKEAANLIAAKEASKQRRFKTALFEGKLTKRNRPEVRGYSGPVGER